MARETIKVHIIGRCPVKGCKNRKRHTVEGQRWTDRYGTHTSWGIPAEPGWGRIHPAPTSMPARPSIYERYALKNESDRAYLAAMRAAKFCCDTHDQFFKVVAVQGVLNEEKACTAKCMGATGAACECACGGELHGATWS